MYIKSKNINTRPALKKEIAEFEYGIRRQWQDDYGYEVEFVWQPKGKYQPVGCWGVLLDGDLMGDVIRETKSGHFFTDFEGTFDNCTDEQVIGNLELMCHIPFEDSDSNPRNVDPEKVAITMNRNARVEAITKWLEQDPANYLDNTEFDVQLKGRNAPVLAISHSVLAEVLRNIADNSYTTYVTIVDEFDCKKDQLLLTTANLKEAAQAKQIYA